MMMRRTVSPPSPLPSGERSARVSAPGEGDYEEFRFTYPLTLALSPQGRGNAPCYRLGIPDTQAMP
jgi:hypothetical protein